MNNTTEYMNKLKKYLKELSKTEILTNTSKELSEKEDKKLLVNKYTRNQIDKALKLIKEDFDSAADILCEIPYLLCSPNKGLNKKKYKIIGSHAVYSLTDSIRHCIRMLGLSSKNNFDNKRIWNNVVFISTK